MIENFLIVLEQVIVLFTLTAIGFICGKANLISEKDESCLASLILYIAAPCVIISSFQRDFNNTLLAGFLTTFIVFTGIYVIGIIISKLTIKSKDERKKHVLQFAVIVGNCGIMGIPLAQSIFGDEGVFYIAAIIAVYNIMIWTYGFYLISNGNGSIQIKKLILNPGILALLIGMILFITPLELPRPIFSAIQHAANLNTPLGMMVIGSRLSRASLRNLFEKGNAWICAADRLLVIPLIAILILYIFNIRGIPAVVCIIAGCAPAASATTMFAVLFHNNESLAANVVSSQTLLSALTMPLVVGLAKYLLS